MAYPTVSAPYGFRPINRVDGMAYAGATRTYEIDPAADIFNGDLVVLDGGVIKPFAGTNSGFPLGVFMGCSYTNSMGQFTNGQYYPAGAADGLAKVVVDDQAAYQVVVTDGAGNVDDTLTTANIGINIAVVLDAGSTRTGDSGFSVNANDINILAAYPIRIIDVVPASKTATGYPEVIVKINVTQFANSTGV